MTARLVLIDSPLELMDGPLETMDAPLALTDGPLELEETHGLTVVESRPGLTCNGLKPHLEIIVPAYNEEIRLGASLQRIAEYLAAQPYCGVITVVDNGSVDRTADLVIDDLDSHVPIRLIGCAQPGKGAAVRRGILTSNATYVGFSDADLSTPIETLDSVLPALEAGHPVVIASRRAPGAEYAVSQPLKRRLASRAFQVAARACHSQLAEVYDTQCGFKFFEADAARRLFAASSASGFAFDVEILALAFMGGYGVKEMPARWTDAEGSNVRVGRDATKVLSELIAVRRDLHTVARSGWIADPWLAPKREVEVANVSFGPGAVKVELPFADEGMTAVA
jgi:dolichyl-phosphate beta-glucosyltransferase